MCLSYVLHNTVTLLLDHQFRANIQAISRPIRCHTVYMLTWGSDLIPITTTSQYTISFSLQQRHKTPSHSHCNNVTKHHLILIATTPQNTISFSLQQRHETPSHSLCNNATKHHLIPIATTS